MKRPRYEVSVTRDPRWVRQAQRLRFLVFSDELGTDIADNGAYGDEFDARCDHLVVREMSGDDVVGTCRILSPDEAHRGGGYHAEQRFDLTQLHLLRGRMVEVGRACVEAEHGSGTAWICGEPALDAELGCADLPILLPLARMHTRYTRHFLAQAA